MTTVGSDSTDSGEIADRARILAERTIDGTSADLRSLDHVTTVDGRTVLEIEIGSGDSFVALYDPSMDGVDTFFELTVDHAVRQLQDSSN